jgi:hypothetical protein
MVVHINLYTYLLVPRCNKLKDIFAKKTTHHVVPLRGNRLFGEALEEYERKAVIFYNSHNEKSSG